jgi:Fur family ferric uptake transcriptional regulator
MNSAHSQTDLLKEAFFEFLKKNKLRRTIERNTILEIVCQTKDTFTLEMVGQQLDEKKIRVSRSSIYDTIKLLLEAQIIVRHQFTGTIVRYELKYAAEQYCRMICTYCDMVQKIKLDNKLKTVLNASKMPRFTVEFRTLHFYGICSKCKYRQTLKITQT